MVRPAQPRSGGSDKFEDIGGEITSTDGVISTRHNAAAWLETLHNQDKQAPFGEWELALQSMETQFKDEQFEDILFVITYAGRTPEWPAY